jgi:hypothetical protein
MWWRVRKRRLDRQISFEVARYGREWILSHIYIDTISTKEFQGTDDCIVMAEYPSVSWFNWDQIKMQLYFERVLIAYWISQSCPRSSRGSHAARRILSRDSSFSFSDPRPGAVPQIICETEISNGKQFLRMVFHCDRKRNAFAGAWSLLQHFARLKGSISFQFNFNGHNSRPRAPDSKLLIQRTQLN